MDRAMAELCVLSRLLVVAALLATNMNVGGDDARVGKCPPENHFERCMPGKHGALHVGKNEKRHAKSSKAHKRIHCAHPVAWT